MAAARAAARGCGRAGGRGKGGQFGRLGFGVQITY